MEGNSGKAHNPQVFSLQCSVQNYVWGKVGKDSEVAQLCSSVDPSFKIEDKPYAELWMGTHPNGPSKIQIQNQSEESLADWIKKNPDKLGARVRDYYKGELPFLFKVLSVQTSLSIQAHPNKVRAELLHKTNPEHYKDKNHKPEMAIALTPFKGMCGFRPIAEVAKFLDEVLPFRKVVGDHNAVQLIAAAKTMDQPLQLQKMKLCFDSLMMAKDELVDTYLTEHLKHVQDLKSKGEDISKFEGDVFLKLNKEFPGDRGCFAIYFLNVITLQPGEAMFLEANLPHAYLSGDCMECMACSDNVVRAGLTIKHRDVHTLVDMLDYTGRPIEKTKFQGLIESANGITTSIFRPPVADFSVTRFEVSKGVETLPLLPSKSASICIVVEGSGEVINATLSSPIPLRKGSVFFISAEEEVTVKVANGESMLLFRASAGL